MDKVRITTQNFGYILNCNSDSVYSPIFKPKTKCVLYMNDTMSYWDSLSKMQGLHNKIFLQEMMVKNGRGHASLYNTIF